MDKREQLLDAIQEFLSSDLPSGTTRYLAEELACSLIDDMANGLGFTNPESSE